MSQGTFQSGGTLRSGSLYIERRADRELLYALRTGIPCHILAPRQMGKSSMRLHAQEGLRKLGSEVRCEMFDLTGIRGHALSAENWFLTLVFELAMRFALPHPAAFWQKYASTSPGFRLSRYIDEVLLNEIKRPFCLFFDEIDSLRSLSFGAEDFLGVLHRSYNQRSEDRRHRMLNFCLLGVVTEQDLLGEPRWILPSRRIRLEDFTPKEARFFLPGLKELPGNPQRWLDEIYAWTRGHPYMTQKLCMGLLENRSHNAHNPGQVVSHLVRALFLNREDNSIQYVDNYFRKVKDPQIPKMLHLYQRLLVEGAEPVAFSETDEVQTGLRMIGLASVETPSASPPRLRVRNHVLAQAFDKNWVRQRLGERFLTAPLAAWLESGEQAKFLLRDPLLEEAHRWANSHGDLTKEEQRFLRESDHLAAQLAEERRRDAVRQQKIEAESRKIAQELLSLQQQRAREKEIRDRRRSLYRRQRGILITGIVTLGLTLSALYAYKEALQREEGQLFQRCLSQELAICLDLAERWQLSCATGNFDRCYHAGVLFDNLHNREHAADLYERACKGGYAIGCLALGLTYEEGKGRERNYAMAFASYQDGCKDGRGSALSCNHVGYLYQKGLGTRHDVAQAAQMYRIACENKSSLGCVNLGFVYESAGNRIFSEESRDKRRKERLYEEALRLYEKACQSKDPRGCASLGYFYQRGHAVEVNYAKAAELYRKACLVGDGQGCNNLGNLYEIGQGVPLDYRSAEKYYKQALERGYALGAVNLGMLYENGPLHTNLAKAVELYRQACNPERSQDPAYRPGCDGLYRLTGIGISTVEEELR